MMRRVFGCSALLAAALLACGCQAIRDAGGDAADGARERMFAWWASEGKDLAKREAGALAEAAKERAVEEAAKLTNAKLRDYEERMAKASVDPAKIDGLVSAFEAWRKLAEEEKRKGTPDPNTEAAKLLAGYLAVKYGARWFEGKVRPQKKEA